MTEAEMKQGRDLCDAYVKRVCGCAAKDASLANECALAKGMPEGLSLHLSLLAGSEGQLNRKETRITEAAARQVIQACVRKDAALDPQACPR